MNRHIKVQCSLKIVIKVFHFFIFYLQLVRKTISNLISHAFSSIAFDDDSFKYGNESRYRFCYHLTGNNSNSIMVLGGITARVVNSSITCIEVTRADPFCVDCPRYIIIRLNYKHIGHKLYSQEKVQGVQVRWSDRSLLRTSSSNPTTSVMQIEVLDNWCGLAPSWKCICYV